MNNLRRIKKISKLFYLVFSVLLFAVPLYYIIYWVFINHFPETMVTVNIETQPLARYPLSPGIRLIGYCASLLPLAALCCGLVYIRKLFSFYREGVIFSYEHVSVFKKIAKALIFWVILSILYESVKSILFSIGNPPGQRVVSVGFSSSEMTMLIVAGIVFVIAWVMDEGRILLEEQHLTV